MTWIEDVVAQHAELESPLTFWYWSGLAALSAVVKDNVWLDQQLYKLYPNIYVMLHATSGLKKGPPISMANKLVYTINNTRIITGRSSIQGILKEMGTAYTAPGGVVVTNSAVFICSSELTSSIVEDKVAMDILMDLYDRHYRIGDWKSLLKAEKFSIKNPTVTMLTATNESHSEEFFAKKDVQGGYFARTFIIYGSKRNVVNSLIDPLTTPLDYDKLALPLKDIAKLKGAFAPLYKTEAGDCYKQWYNEVLIKIQDESEDETGTINRFGDSVLKVAMLLALSEGTFPNISVKAMQEAIEQCEKLIGHARKVTMGRKGRSSYANQKVMILEKLLTREPHMISRQQLMKDMYYHLNPSELDEIMLGFHQAGTIQTEQHGNQMVYVMNDEQVEKLKDWLAGKRKK